MGAVGEVDTGCRELLCRVEERVAVLTLNRPEARNALTWDMKAALVEQVPRLGADVPRWLYKRLESLKDDEACIRAFGIEVVSRLCEDLIGSGVPGLHFYTLNRWGATMAICRNLGLAKSGS